MSTNPPSPYAQLGYPDTKKLFSLMSPDAREVFQRHIEAANGTSIKYLEVQTGIIRGWERALDDSKYILRQHQAKVQELQQEGLVTPEVEAHYARLSHTALEQLQQTFQSYAQRMISILEL